jgi:hypothetical protein
MHRSPGSVEIAFSHGGLTHYGGILFFNEFTRVLQFRRFLTRHLLYPRRNQRYTLSQMIMALVYPVILGLDRLETASFLRSNGTWIIARKRDSAHRWRVDAASAARLV